MRSLLANDPLFVPARHDELWVLRFVLSHKGSVSNAASAARGALAFRRKYNLDDPDLAVAGPAAAHVPEVAKFFACMKDPAGMVTYLPDPDRGPFLVITPALVHPPAILSGVSFEEHYHDQMLTVEWLSRQCDATTRRTGYLTKYIRLVHLEDLALANFSWALVKRISAISKDMEDYYPQLLCSLLICHAPSWINGLFRVIRPILPPRVIEKMDFVRPNAVRRDLDRLQRHIKYEHIPRFLGGSAPWPPTNARFAEAQSQ